MTKYPMKNITHTDRLMMISALRAGVVPRVGLQHIQVGRSAELEAIIGDIECIADGKAAFRIIAGDYGSGKTFFLSLLRNIALQKRLVVCTADLSTQRRLHSTDGHARALYVELLRNTSLRSAPSGNALGLIVETFLELCSADAARTGRSLFETANNRLAPVRLLTCGFEFSKVIMVYLEAHEDGNPELQELALKWIRGEYPALAEARRDLGVRAVISDRNVNDVLKVFATFVRLAGFSGLLVCMDEVGYLTRIPHAHARSQNYEKLLQMINDALSGNDRAIGFVMTGTRDFLTDPRRGVASHDALRSRLEENFFARSGHLDRHGPVISLSRLSNEETFHLLERLRDLFAIGGAPNVDLPDVALKNFLEHCGRRLGSFQFQTTRSVTRAFCEMLSILEQSPESKWSDLLPGVEVQPDHEVADNVSAQDELTTIRI